MSAYYATVNAYDVMDTVFIVLSLRSTTGDREECIESVMHLSTTIPSTGERDPRAWFVDALVGALETL